METKAKKCWPWSHSWTFWQQAEGFTHNRGTGQTEDACVQVRQCTKCGFSQIEGLRGR